MIGSIGSSSSTRDERRLDADDVGCGAAVCAKASEKLACELGGGRGERERDVDRELCPDRLARTGTCMLRDSRRDGRPGLLREGPATEGGSTRSRVMGASGRTMLLPADDGGEFKGLGSHGTGCVLRSEAGLSDWLDAGPRPGDEVL